ncbi:MAG: hypothetical protein LBT05_01555 [Planctomycetaceae bacterium]|jgi:hypothetical protein|nr:hypothetical protein [Planctomycetaceae bacterium]
MKKNAILICSLLLFTILPTGCAKKRTEVTITGTVTVAGKPVDSGMIQFIPVNQDSFEGGGIIANGKFTATVPYGELHVRFRGNEYLKKDAQGNPLGGKDETDKDGMRSYTPPPTRQMIPDKYWFGNEATTTVITGKEEFNFDLEAK